MSDNTNKGELFMKIEKLTAERDAALAQNAELVAQVEAWRATLEYFVSQEFEWNDPHDSMIDDIHNLLDLTPQQCLREIQSDAGRDGFVAGMHSQLHNRHCSQMDQDLAADQYSESVRRGGA